MMSFGVFPRMPFIRENFQCLFQVGDCFLLVGALLALDTFTIGDAKLNVGSREVGGRIFFGEELEGISIACDRLLFILSGYACNSIYISISQVMLRPRVICR